MLFLASLAASGCESDVHEQLVNDLQRPPSVYSGPYVLSAASTSNTGVTVSFSEQVEQASSENPANYSIPGLTVLSATRSVSDFSIIDLVTTPQSAILYTLAVSNIRDLAGTITGAPDTGTFTGTNPACSLSLAGAAATSSTTVRLTFTDNVDATTAENAANYSIPGLTVSAATRDIVDFRIVDLTTSSQSAVGYTVTASGVTCVTGELIGLPDAQTFLGNPPPCSLSLSSAASTSNTSVLLTFNTDVDLTTAENAGNYSIPGLTVLSAARDAVDFSIVHLTTSSQSAISYDVTASGVKCVTGELIGLPDTATFTGTNPPCNLSLSGAASTSSASVRLIFTDDVDLTTSENTASYAIPGLTVLSAARDAVDYYIVDLATSAQGAVSYTVSASGVKCATGELIGLPDSQSFTGTAGCLLTLSDAVSTSSTSVRLTFSADVDSMTAETTANYSIPGLAVTSAMRDAVNLNIVDLTTSSQASVDFTVTVSNVTCTTGEAISSPNWHTFLGTDPPCSFTLSNAASTSPETVRLAFTTDVDQVTAENTASYSIPGLTVLAAARNAGDFSIVELTTDTQSAVSYTVTAAGVKCSTGEAIGSPDWASFTGTEPPPVCTLTVSGAASTSNTSVRVTFSADADQATAETPGNYSIPGLTVTGAVRNGSDYKLVDLTTSSQTAVGYTVTASNVKCVTGELIGAPNSAGFTGTDPPAVCSLTITGAAATSSSTVRVTFSNDVDQATAETPGNYAIPGLSVTGAVRNGGDFKLVDLTTSAQSDINYTVTAANVKCSTGELIGSPNAANFTGDVPPAIRSVSSAGNTFIIVYFSEPVDQATAETKTNYVLSPSLAISTALRDATDLSKVVLTSAGQTSGTAYKLSVSNVKDLTANAIAASAAGYFTGTGAADSTAPFVISASRVLDSTAEIIFSEAVDLASSQTKGNYGIKDSTGASAVITGAVRQADTSRVRLTISGSFTDHLYTVTVSSSVKDMAGNAMQASPMNKTSFAGMGTMPQTFGDGPVMVDPMQEGANSFTLMVKYRDRIYIGPSSADNAMFRMRADGSEPELVTFKFHGVSTTTTSLNPGPDAETGVDCFAGGLIGGSEYLFLAPGKSSGNLNYLYYTTDTGKTLNFNYMNYGVIVDGGSKGTSAIAVFNGRLYTGFPGTGGQRPFFAKLLNVVQSPVKSIDIINLVGCDITRIGNSGAIKNSGNIVGIDVLLVWDDRLYVANGGGIKTNQDGGIVRSTNNDPTSTDWEDITPALLNPWYNLPTKDRFSIELTSNGSITPAMRAFPAMVVFNGKMYAARNTTTGPQIWKYDGASWTLVADSGSGLSDMGNVNNADISMLIVNGDRLYVGYDNYTDGVMVYRTKSLVTDPSTAADFEQEGANGLGDPSGNQTIFSSLSASHNSVDYLWIMCGKSSVNQRLYRTKN